MYTHPKDQPTMDVEAFARAEQALKDAGIGFIVVEESVRPVAKPTPATVRPLAA